MRGNVAKRLKKIFQGIAECYDFAIDTIEDHVHLILIAPPRYAPVGIVQIVKSISAKKVFEEFPEIKEKLW